MWTVVGFGVQRLNQLISNLVLTRLLFPEAFGLMAIANILLIGLNMFSDVGLKPAIVQSIRDDETFLNTAWTLQVIRGAGLWAAACAAAYPISIAYEQPVLFPLLCALGSTCAINGLSSISMATRERRLALAPVIMVQTGGQLATAVITGLAAWQLGSVWALTWGAIAGAIVTTCIGHLMLREHSHRLLLDKGAMFELISFGKWVLLSTAVVFLGGHGMRAIQAFFVPLQTMGILTISQTFAAMPSELGIMVLSSVAFPALSEMYKVSGVRFRAVVTRVRSAFLLFIITPYLFLSLISFWLIDKLYDDRYSTAGSYLSIMALTGAVSAISVPYENAYLSMGRSRLQFACVGVALACRMAGLVAGYYVGGTEGMLIGLGFGSLLAYMFVAANAWRLRILTPLLDGATLLAIGIVSLWQALGVNHASSSDPVKIAGPELSVVTNVPCTRCRFFTSV
jgi:O-antigen/teichoic acid export membrane protein